MASSIPNFTELLPKTLRSILAADDQVQLVIAKRLTAADMAKETLLIPSFQMSSPNFLTFEEQSQLKQSNNPIVATIMDASTLKSMCSVALVRVRSGTGYLITSNWSAVLKKKKEALVEGALVRLWSFRRGGGELRLAVEAVAAEEEKEVMMVMCGFLAHRYLEMEERRNRLRWTMNVLDRLRALDDE
ncbi:hypothetical protein LINPERHAP1_LOCUS33461 [Linum perenne]